MQKAELEDSLHSLEDQLQGMRVREERMTSEEREREQEAAGWEHSTREVCWGGGGDG